MCPSRHPATRRDLRVGPADRQGCPERLVSGMETTTPLEAPPTLLLTLSEVATHLRCTRRSVERQVAHHALHVIRFGRSVRVERTRAGTVHRPTSASSPMRGRRRLAAGDTAPSRYRGSDGRWHARVTTGSGWTVARSASTSAGQRSPSWNARSAISSGHATPARPHGPAATRRCSSGWSTGSRRSCPPRSAGRRSRPTAARSGCMSFPSSAPRA